MHLIIADSGSPRQGPTYALAIGIAMNFMREMCGDEWRTEEVMFSFAGHDPGL